MSQKYCDNCNDPHEQIVMKCPGCGCTTFVHGAEIMRRDKKERAESPKVANPAPTPDLRPITSKSEKISAERPATPTPWSASENSQTGKTLDDLIRAQNRTTHAVRAFVRFLFIQLTGITFAVFLWQLSLAFISPSDCSRNGENCFGNPFVQFMAVAVWIATVILSSRAGWEELEKSNIK